MDAPETESPDSDVLTSDPLDWSHLSTGERWRANYQVGEQLPDQSMGRNFRAVHIGTAQDVVIRAFRSTDEVRGQTWNLLKGLEGVIVEPIEALEHEERRVEVSGLPPALSLKEWGAKRKAGSVELRMMAAELHRIVSALHDRGLVHLGLRPDKVFVSSMTDGVHLVVGGLESITMMQQGALVSAVVHPFYAPPEAAGLYQHAPGKSLRAWDWWSVGRILQEMALGRHVLGHILERDVTRQTPELLARAETLVSEQDESGLRAGAVECMPSMDKELHPLLKGLLTSCRDARWGGGELKRWLNQEPVKERYGLPKNERLFIWDDRAFTVPEAAEYFAQGDHWKDGIFNLNNPSDSTTLLFFMNEVPGMQKVKERLEGYLKLKESSALIALPIEVKQDLIACVAWAQMAAGTCRPKLLGRELDAECLRHLLQADLQPQGLAYLRGLLSRPVMQHIEQLDAVAARFLAEFEKVSAAALTFAKTNGWIIEENFAEVACLYRLCLEPDVELRKILDAMRREFACSRLIVLDRTFKKAAPNLADLALLAFTHQDTARFEYVTHAEWMTDHYRILKERGTRLQVAISWMNLERAMRMGPLVFGNWRLSLIVWAVLSVSVLLTRQWSMVGMVVLAPLLAVAACKILWYRLNKALIDAHLPPGEGWAIMDGGNRALGRALEALDVASAPAIRDLRKSFRDINDDIGKLTLQPPPVKIQAPRRCLSAWLVAGVSWIFTVGALGGTVYTLIKHPPKLPQMVTSVVSGRSTEEEPDLKNLKEQKGKGWTSALSPDEKERHERTVEEDIQDSADLTKALEEVKRLREEHAKLPKPPPKIAWGFKVDPNPKSVRLRGAEEASARQAQVATTLATASLARFDQKTIDAVIAVRVPTDKGVGLMLWDGRNARLMNRSVMKINYVPLSRSWLEIGGKTVFYLGTN